MSTTADVPRRSILISLRCCMRSRLSWFSISSFRALPSFSSVLIPQPILATWPRQAKEANVCLRWMALAAERRSVKMPPFSSRHALDVAATESEFLQSSDGSANQSAPTLPALLRGIAAVARGLQGHSATFQPDGFRDVIGEELFPTRRKVRAWDGTGRVFGLRLDNLLGVYQSLPSLQLATHSNWV